MPSNSTLNPIAFRYTVQVYPHHTDYAGVVWHGSYVNWMEEVRIAYLESRGMTYQDVVAQDCDLMVVNLQISYKKSPRMGDRLLWEVMIHPLQGVRSIWDYFLWDPTRQTLYATAQVTLVPVSRQTGKITRSLPEELQKILKNNT